MTTRQGGYAAIAAVAKLPGMAAETMRKRIGQAEIDGGQAPGEAVRERRRHVKFGGSHVRERRLSGHGLASLYPATRAARLSPTEALRTS